MYINPKNLFKGWNNCNKRDASKKSLVNFMTDSFLVLSDMLIQKIDKLWQDTTDLCKYFKVDKIITVAARPSDGILPLNNLSKVW